MMTLAALHHSLPTPPSMLSVNAPVFTPRAPSAGNHAGATSMAQPANKPTYNVPPPNISRPPPSQPPSMGPPPPHGMGDQFLNNFNQMNLGENAGGDSGEMDFLLEEFTRTMLVLTTHPANVRDFLKPMCDNLRRTRSHELLDEVINILYAQSIYEPNFRYTGARVVHFLCQELKDHDVFGSFKMKFLKKCQADYMQREKLISSGPEGLNTLCGLTMFMGELFLNVTADASGQTERLDFLSSALTDLLLTLLSQPSDISIKTTCQLLKLAGGPTEDSMSQKPPNEMQKFNNIFSTLQILQNATLPQISQNMKVLANSVLNLRQNNWGRADTRSSDNSHENNVPQGDFTQPYSFQSEPVFYNQYGKQITREEAGYQQEEDDDEEYDGYELTEEEERDFLIWQKETSDCEEFGVYSQLGMAAPGPMPNSNGPSGMYQQWSTATESDNYGSSSYYQDYPQNYDYNTYPPFEEEGFNDEMEKAYEEFLSSQRGPPSGK